MKVKLLKSVLVGPADVIATRAGTTVDLPDDEARQFIDAGLAVAADGKQVLVASNKMAPEPDNKTIHQPTQEATTKK